MNTQDFGKLLQEKGFKHFAGVPCSYLSPLINWAINENALIMANNEGDAVAIASGISLMNRPKEFGVCFMQNSGLTNAISPLTSLNATFELPILGFVSLRGGENDEPQHALMGNITKKMLRLCAVETAYLSKDLKQAHQQLNQALRVLKSGKSFFFMVRKNVFEKVALTEQNSPILKNGYVSEYPLSSNLPSLKKVLKVIQRYSDDYLTLATTGFTSRVLFDLQDNPNQLYMTGSMGCVSALALGVSLKTSVPVMAIDGDSALLMRLGTLPANAFYARNKRFCHIVLNNSCHLSTGGQANLSPCVNFAQIAASCGYHFCASLSSLEDLEEALHFVSYGFNETAFIEVKTNATPPKKLSRPNVAPKDVALRFQKWAKKRPKQKQKLIEEFKQKQREELEQQQREELEQQQD